jgi:molybdopterin-containing oxidoreductase family iron-sulfur binding subunit
MTDHAMHEDAALSPAPGLRKDLDLGAVRQRLAGESGRTYWRSLAEAARTPEFERMVHREFPVLASEWQEDGVSRRRFMQLMSASVAFGGLAACTRQPLEKIVPYVDQPEQMVPGRPLHFATAMETDGYAQSLLAESHMGRPTKIEGNPEHPASLGATDLYAQASVLDLYDPDRSQTVTELGRIRTWAAFGDAMTSQIQLQGALGGLRLRILTPPVTSPTLGRLLATVLAETPRARWHQYASVSTHNRLEAQQKLFGRPLSARYEFSKADVVLSLDADFLTQGPSAVRYSRDFMDRRRVRAGETAINRLYAVESSPTSTGSVADHRLAASSAELARFTAALAQAVGQAARPGEDRLDELAAIVARDLEDHRGRSLVLAGDHASAGVQMLAHWLNHELGNVGSTVTYHEAIEVEPTDGVASLRSLVADMKAGEVDMLLILGSNPAYDAPADLDFTAAMQNVPTCIHLGQSLNETSEYCQWHLPEAHYLESWGDSRADDGTVTLTQPLIEPLYDGRTAAEVLALFTAAGPAAGDELLQATWRERVEGDFDALWRRYLHDGFIPGTAATAITPELNERAVATSKIALGALRGDDIEVSFRPDPTVYDGRYANNGWLQECPKPLTKLTWDNAALVSPRLAERLGLTHEQVIALTVDSRRLEIPVWVQPGQAEGTITLALGYGRRKTGRVGTGTGFDAGRLRSTNGMWASPVTVEPLAGTYSLASTQMHSNIEEDPYQGENLEGRTAQARHLIRQATVEEFERQPDFPHHVGHGMDESLSLMPGYDYSGGHAWSLSVDLNSCTSCNACVIACQSENNIPVVGKEEVAKGREMHWIRIDRYYEGELDDPTLHSQPVMCMHCEQAPCEVVCPVAATVHNTEGLNDMVYNRCVGTRYCANNCPYKVRRFNFFKYSDTKTPSLKMMRNPDVTVRTRGVMEKCSYCVQRINQAAIGARKENRRVRDGEIETACQQVCPTEAIVFGDMNDPSSKVAQLKAQPHDYGLLTELGTRPRTTYLAKVGNPNPAWPATGAAGDAHHG